MSTKKVVLDSGAGSDATLAITPGKKGYKKYKIHYTLEDSGPGRWTVLTVNYQLSNGNSGSAQASNRSRGRASGNLTISAGSKVKAMSARVRREAEGDDSGLITNTEPDVFS